MSVSGIESLKIRAKLLQKAKKKLGQSFLLKDALEVVAKSAGFDSWRELKQSFAASEQFCPPGTSAHWKTWYASYAEAKSHLDNKEGFLLPYRKQFFVCDADYIEVLGVLRNDADLQKVGNNWVEPRDIEAWARVLQKIKVHQTKS